MNLIISYHPITIYTLGPFKGKLETTNLTNLSHFQENQVATWIDALRVGFRGQC